MLCLQLGSVQGPALFTLYINDNASCVTGCNIHLYADDTILYGNVDAGHSAVKSLQCCFAYFQVDLNNYKLVLNADKTTLMLFTRAKNIDYDNLIISNKNIRNIEKVTFFLEREANF